jgi:hypothetical protein
MDRKRCVIADASSSFLEELETLLPAIALTFESEYGQTEIEVFYATSPKPLRKVFKIGEFKTQLILTEDENPLPSELNEDAQPATVGSLAVGKGGFSLGMSFPAMGGSDVKGAIEAARSAGYSSMIILCDGWIV